MSFRRNFRLNKKERKDSLRYLINCLLRKTSQTISNRIRCGSITVEAAAVLPVFLFGMIAMFTLMNLWTVKTKTLVSVCEEAKGSALTSVEEGGESEITISRENVYHPIGPGLSLFDIPIHTSITVHSWNGADEAGLFGEEAEEMVIITLHGSVYHTDINCSYIDLSIKEAAGAEISSLRNKYGEKYKACETCSYHQEPAAVVRITDSGNRYHNNGSCSDLKRTVQVVPISEVSGMHICSRCRGK